MFQRILVPLDGSPRAECAIPIAARLARASGGAVILLRTVNEAHNSWSSMGVSSSRLAEPIVDADLADAELYLAELTVSPDLKDISTETVVLCGQAAPMILSAASSSHAGVIVLCSHGYTGMKRWVLGSVAEKVVHAALIPVLLLREEGSLPLGPHVNDTRPLRILVPLDGSVYAKAALVPAAYLVAALATPDKGVIHVMRVAQPLPTMNAEEQQEERKRMLHRAKEYLSTTAEDIREGRVAHPIANLNLPVTWSITVDTDAAEAIIRVAENGGDAEGAGVFGGCDIIAIATHEHGWVTGSVTERVLHATKLPLLIIRPTTMMDGSHSTEEKTITATFQHA